jgi:hypothetical protein
MPIRVRLFPSDALGDFLREAFELLGREAWRVQLRHLAAATFREQIIFWYSSE